MLNNAMIFQSNRLIHGDRMLNNVQIIIFNSTECINTCFSAKVQFQRKRYEKNFIVSVSAFFKVRMGHP